MPQAQPTINGVPGSNSDLPINTLVNLGNNGIGDELTYTWTILDQPTGTADALSATNIATPSLTPKKEGSYLVQLIVNAGLPTEKRAKIILGIRELKSRVRIPAAGETTEVDAADGWAPHVNEAIRDSANLKYSGIVLGVLAAGMPAGSCVYISGYTTLKGGLPGEEKIPSFALAQASSLNDVKRPLYILESGVAGALTAGQIVRARFVGRYGPLAMAGVAVNDPIYVNDLGALSKTPGTYTRQIGICTWTDGANIELVVQSSGPTAIETARHLVTSLIGSPSAGQVDVGAAPAQVVFKPSAGNIVPVGAQAFAGQTADLFQILDSAGTKQSYFGAAGELDVRSVVKIGEAPAAVGSSNAQLILRSRDGGTQYRHFFETWNSAAGVRLYRDDNAGVQGNVTLDVGKQDATATFAGQLNLHGANGANWFAGSLAVRPSSAALVIGATQNGGNSILVMEPSSGAVFIGDPYNTAADYTGQLVTYAYSTFYGRPANFRVTPSPANNWITLDNNADGWTTALRLSFVYVDVVNTDIRFNRITDGWSYQSAVIHAYADTGAGSTDEIRQTFSSPDGGVRFQRFVSGGAARDTTLHIGSVSTAAVEGYLQLHGGDGFTWYSGQLFIDPSTAAMKVWSSGNIDRFTSYLPKFYIGQTSTFSSFTPDFRLIGYDSAFGGGEYQFQITFDLSQTKVVFGNAGDATIPTIKFDNFTTFQIGDASILHLNSDAQAGTPTAASFVFGVAHGGVLYSTYLQTTTTGEGLIVKKQTSVGVAVQTDFYVGNVGTTTGVTGKVIVHGGNGAGSSGQAAFYINTADVTQALLDGNGTGVTKLKISSLHLDVGGGTARNIYLSAAGAQQVYKQGTGDLQIGTDSGAGLLRFYTSNTLRWYINSLGDLVSFSSYKLSGVGDPVSTDDAATKNYTDTKFNPNVYQWGNTTGPAASTTNYGDPGFGGRATQANEIKFRVPSNGVLRRLYVRARVGNTGGTTTFTIRLNGVDQALATSLGAGATTNQDTSNQVSVSAGDDISLKVAGGAGITVSLVDFVVTCEYTRT